MTDPVPTSRSDPAAARRGVLAMVAACAVWGLLPIFYKSLTHVPPLEVLSHRALWSLAVFGLVLLAQRRLHEVPGAMGSPRKLALLALASAMIAVNWLIFIWAIGVDRVTETSFGYYIFPLVAVVFGLLLFGERLGRIKLAAVALAAIAVLILGVGPGAAPWISLVLAGTFGVYGVLKKLVAAGPVVSVTAEILLVAPFAASFLVFAARGQPPLDLPTLGLLALSGPLTAGPLILFSYASKRVGLATLGLIQYLNPTLQFLCAAVLFAEPVTVWHMIAFPLIWAALAIYSLNALAQERSARRARVSSSTVAATET